MTEDAKAEGDGRASRMSENQLRRLLSRVSDPEIPVLTIEDLGILRDIRIDGARVEVDITPTYTGCPAMDMIAREVRETLERAGVRDPSVRLVLAPAWTTDWLSEEGRRKLREYGIAPPERSHKSKTALLFEAAASVTCPNCGSHATQRLSEFGSTPCKAQYRCESCLEPFEHFKCI